MSATRLYFPELLKYNNYAEFITQTFIKQCILASHVNIVITVNWNQLTTTFVIISSSEKDILAISEPAYTYHQIICAEESQFYIKGTTIPTQ